MQPQCKECATGRNASRLSHSIMIRRNRLVIAVASVAALLLLFRLTALGYLFSRMFRDSGYSWWIQVPAAAALVALGVALTKRYRPGRFDGPF